MKITRTLALALGLLAALVLSGEAWLEMRSEEQRAESTLSRDQGLLATSLRPLFVYTYERRGAQAASELLGRVNAAQDQLKVRFLEGAPAPSASDRPAKDRIWEGGVELFITRLPVEGIGVKGILEVRQSFRFLEEQQRASVVSLALATAAIALLFWLGTLALGRRMVGQPIQALVSMAQSLGQGDLSARVSDLPHNELGMLGGTMNQMGEALQKARVALEKETADKLEALEHLRHADRLNTVGKMAAGMAHELGTPLNVVQERARMIVANPSEAEQSARNAQIIVDESRGMARLIRQLLDYSRQRSPAPARTTLRAVVENTLNLLQPLAGKRLVSLRLSPGEDVSLQLDVGAAQQALTNVVMNGVQAMSQAGAISVRVVELKDQGMSCVEVEDEGPGIAPEVLPNIFEPFFTTKAAGEGTGLGLSVAWKLVQDQGGWIDVQSEVGKGTRFRLYFPLEAKS